MKPHFVVALSLTLLIGCGPEQPAQSGQAPAVAYKPASKELLAAFAGVPIPPSWEAIPLSQDARQISARFRGPVGIGVDEFFKELQSKGWVADKSNPTDVPSERSEQAGGTYRFHQDKKLLTLKHTIVSRGMEELLIILEHAGRPSEGVTKIELRRSWMGGAEVITFRRDGAASRSLQGHTGLGAPEPGQYSGGLRQEDFQELALALEKMDYRSLRESYQGRAHDAESNVLTVSSADGDKTIRETMAGRPATLDAFFDLVRKKASSIQWKPAYGPDPGAAARTIHEHFGLDEDAVVEIAVWHAPRGDFSAPDVTSAVTRDARLIGDVLEVLKQLPAPGTVHKLFPGDIEQWRVELRTRSGKAHRLTFYGIKLRSPQTQGGSFYGGPEAEEQEKRLLKLIRRIAEPGVGGGKPGDELQGRLLPGRQHGSVPAGETKPRNDSPEAARAAVKSFLEKSGKRTDKYSISVTQPGLLKSTFVARVTEDTGAPFESQWRYLVFEDGAVQALNAGNLAAAYRRERIAVSEELNPWRICTSIIDIVDGLRPKVVSSVSDIPGHEKHPLDADLQAVVRAPWHFTDKEGNLYWIGTTWSQTGGIVKRYKFVFRQGLIGNPVEVIVLGNLIGAYALPE